MPFAAYFEHVWGFPLAGPAGSGVEGSLDDLLVVARELMEPTRMQPRDARTRRSRCSSPASSASCRASAARTPNDWGLGIELRDGKSPHWTGARNSPRTFGHFGRSGTFLWVDPDAGIALACLTDRDFGDWAREAWPRLSDAVLAEAVRTL